MRIKRLLLLLLLPCLVLTACQTAPTEEEGSEYQVYFSVSNPDFGEAALKSERHVISEETEPISELLRLLLAGPEGEGLVSVIPSDVRVWYWTLYDDVLYVNFSRPYASLPGIRLTLADYSVTMTLSQVPQVSAVVIMVEGERISYRDHQNLEADDILLSIYRMEPEEREVTLFFPREDGSGLSQELRMIFLGEEDTLVMTLLEALAQGPAESESMDFLEGEDILSVEVQEEVCTLDLSAAFQERAGGEAALDQLVIDALVRTLCELETVSAVYLQVQGEEMTTYGSVTLAQPLTTDDEAASTDNE